MPRKPPPDRTEQMDDASLTAVDDGELCSYEVVNGELVETVVRPARPRRIKGRRR